ncbi:uncharacterized protein Z518_03956 [Rhinocladiella mackenziei CBS 650.93]|uniref:Beta-hexosaminidase n=1 Tax=Rhinocladiella mackenziei CBS 650.93 TaxID=1442369 RepID=A0A0D2FV73_9EURO|nr:uncharacterized protein Z518_03956 [Rhinocladiella mackenziei CBS 650.93]KIX05982.1 hypothetical protein Z518_03956 [Rhinocladiella mackenziei CBS 650.93]
MLFRIGAMLLCVTTSRAIWPQPADMTSGTNVLWLDPAAKATFRCDGAELALCDDFLGFGNNRLLNLMNDAFQFFQDLLDWFPFSLGNKCGHDAQSPLTEVSIVRRAVRETIASTHKSRFVPWKFHKRKSDFEPGASAPRHYLSTLQIVQNGCPETRTFHPATFFAGDESYEITVDNVTAIIKANCTIGTLRGLQTFQQLFFAHSTFSGSYLPHTPVKIVDRPKWPHRGLSIDIARNPFHPRDLIRTIDAMFMAKMNRLHVHATDSQSWPLEIPSLPELAKRGAYQPHLVWTASTLEEVQRYGALKGVSVFVEIDMPGHTASVAHAYPDLIAAFSELDWSTFAAEPLSGQLKLNSSAVFKFVSDVLQDLLPRTSDYTRLYHLGGDEVNRAAYLLDDTVRSDDPQVLQPLLQKLIDHVTGIVTQHGLQPIVWEEMLLDWNLTLPSLQNGDQSTSTLVQVWRNSERIEEVLKRGHRAIFGDYHYWYLDCGYGIFLDPYPTGKSPPGVPFNTSGGSSSKLKPPYLDYCGPFHNWRHMYMYNPLANISDDLQHGIEGGEVLMWSEQTDSIDLDTKLWPRAAAAAEVLWSGLREETMLEDASKRLGEWRERGVTDLGIRMSPVQMTWCLMEGACNL